MQSDSTERHTQDKSPDAARVWLNKSIKCSSFAYVTYEGVSKSFRTGLLEREMQMVQLSATRCSYVAILWVSIVSFVAITLCAGFQWVFIVVGFLISLSTQSGNFWVHPRIDQTRSEWVQGDYQTCKDWPVRYWNHSHKYEEEMWPHFPESSLNRMRDKTGVIQNYCHFIF
jgi:hypothetical protein